MMKHLVRLLVFSLFVITVHADDNPAPSPAPNPYPASVTQECGELATSVKVKYCMIQQAGSSNTNILYFMHGKGGAETNWELNGNIDIIKKWVEQGKPMPTIITFSFGPFWLLAEKTETPDTGYLEVIADEAIPKMEEKLGGLKGSRFLFGMSMGGFNAAELMLKRPGMFSRLALACPAIVSISPNAGFSAIWDYASRTNASFWDVYQVAMLAQHFFPTEEAWQKASPLILAETKLGPTSPSMNISCGDKDEYGFFEGAKLFADKAKEKGVTSIDWQLLSGGHCVYNVPSLANFLNP